MKSTTQWITALLLLLLASAAQAGSVPTIDVSWESTTTAIPTLGFWGLLGLAALLAVMGVRLMKSHSTPARLMSLTLVMSAIVVTTQTARTGAEGVMVGGSDCQGGSATYGFNNERELINNCPGAVIISGYDYPSGGEIDACFELADETCPVGQVVPGNGGSCDLNIFEDNEACS